VLDLQGRTERVELVRACCGPVTAAARLTFLPEIESLDCKPVTILDQLGHVLIEQNLPSDKSMLFKRLEH